MKQTNYIVVGGGIAGLLSAYLLSDFGDIIVISKEKISIDSAYRSQGGIAAVIDKEDSFESHINDTLKAGLGHCDKHAVRYLVEHAPKAIRLLESIGIKFQKENIPESGHSYNRIWRTGDFTEQDILKKLIKLCKRTKSITFLEKTDVIELITKNNSCIGVYIKNIKKPEIDVIFSNNVILATGGAGDVFSKTTNTNESIGSGLVLALKAGLKLKDLEFIQFYPTTFLKAEKGKHFLFPEGVRGIGAKITDKNGNRFLQDFDKRAELAPIDLISRAIYFEFMNGPVYLDMRHLDSLKVKELFPNIIKKLKEYEFNFKEDLIPIIPAVNYFSGGIPVNLKGETELSGLFAIGETAYTGVHGASSLASNPLLETIVFTQSMINNLKSTQLNKKDHISLNTLTFPKISTEQEGNVGGYNRRIRKLMWKNMGIIRSKDSMETAKKEIESMPARDYRIQNNMMLCLEIIKASLLRTENLGVHYVVEDLN